MVKMLRSLLSGAAMTSIFLFVQTSSTTNPLVIKGYHFFDSETGKYFPIKGVNYYPRPNRGKLDINNFDFFTDDFEKVWSRDVPQFERVNANTIRLYAVDPSKSHDGFMCELQRAGIYVIVDLGANCKDCAVTGEKTPICYPENLKTRGQMIIQNFSKYDNVIGFSGGNEINHFTGGRPPSWNAPCQKKFVKDMRDYIASCSETMRQIPVGLVLADTHREDNANYYNCRTNPSDKNENAEWFGINVYVHCGDVEDPKRAAGFNLLYNSFKSLKYSIPVVLTEFGCVNPSFPTVDGYRAQRTFHDAKFMNSEPYNEVFNGGLVFEYSTENANSKSTSSYPFKNYGPQNYGLGYFSPENCDDVNIPCVFEPMPNYNFLAEAYSTKTATNIPSMDAFEPASDRTNPTVCPKSFPKLSDFEWSADTLENLACPSEPNTFVCPGTIPGKREYTPTPAPSPGVTPNPTRKAATPSPDTKKALSFANPDNSSVAANSLQPNVMLLVGTFLLIFINYI